MTEFNVATCEHGGSLSLEPGEEGGYRVLCGACWLLGPEGEGPSDAIRAFREAQGLLPEPGRAA